MEKDIIMAGFGGQGVMLMGKLLSYAASESTELHVTFFPSYGAEQRGGTANCYVVLSDETVGSPMPRQADDLIVLNQTSLDKFASHLRTGFRIALISRWYPCRSHSCPSIWATRRF